LTGLQHDEVAGWNF